MGLTDAENARDGRELPLEGSGWPAGSRTPSPESGSNPPLLEFSGSDIRYRTLELGSVLGLSSSRFQKSWNCLMHRSHMVYTHFSDQVPAGSKKSGTGSGEPSKFQVAGTANLRRKGEQRIGGIRRVARPIAIASRAYEVDKNCQHLLCLL